MEIIKEKRQLNPTISHNLDPRQPTNTSSNGCRGLLGCIGYKGFSLSFIPSFYTHTIITFKRFFLWDNRQGNNSMGLEGEGRDGGKGMILLKRY